jgi:alkylation response protein AidB-like acyl-CoA dehydrogenase
MDFTLSDDQELLRETARTLFAKECPTTLVRAHAEDASAADALNERLREFAGLADAPLVDLCLFLEEAGAALAPGPFLATAATFVPLARAIGHASADAAAAGTATGTVAVAGRAGAWVPNTEPRKSFVLEADRVDHVAVLDATDDGAVAVRVLERPAVRVLRTVDTTRHVCELESPLDTPPLAHITADEAGGLRERAVVAMAADLLGASRWIFDATLAYAKVREQFDRPIGSFQAVKHKLADMALARERAWSAVYYAAMAIDADDPDRHRAAHVAKSAAGDAARRCAKDGAQIHGGIGYTWEHDLHLFIRRVYASEFLVGDSDWHRDQLAALLLD